MFQSLKRHKPKFVSELVRSRQKRAPSRAFNLSQMCKEREQAAKASKHQLKTIMLELRTLKEKQEKDTTDRKVGGKALLDNIKASIDPILKSDHKSSDHIGIGACLKNLQEEVTNYLASMVNKNMEQPSQLMTHLVIGPLVVLTPIGTCISQALPLNQRLVTFT